MVCAAARSVSGTDVTCDLNLTNTHGGRHSGLIPSFNLFGRNWTSTRIYWETACARSVFQKPITLGEGDFVGIANQTATLTTGITPNGGGGGATPYDETTPFISSGTFTIPAEATKLDIICLGAGGTGHSSQFPDPSGLCGAGAGQWSSVTLIRGTDIPQGTTSLTVTIGTAPASPAYLGDGGPGGSTTVSGTGMTTVTGAGGYGGSQFTANTGGAGLSPGNHTRNGKTYNGGAAVGVGANGSVPGGGAGSGVYFGFGGVGGRGQVWIRAYNT